MYFRLESLNCVECCWEVKGPQFGTLEKASSLHCLHFHISSCLQPPLTKLLSSQFTDAALVRVPRNPICHILCTLNFLAPFSTKAGPETKTCMHSFVWGKDSRELTYRSQRRRESRHGCVLGLAMVIGDWCSWCWIQKTLTYKTLKSLIKYASELFVWETKEKACVFQIPSPPAHGWDPTYVIFPVPTKCQVGFHSAGQRSSREGGGRYRVPTSCRRYLAVPAWSLQSLCGTCHCNSDWHKHWSWEDVKESQASWHHIYQVPVIVFSDFSASHPNVDTPHGCILELLVFKSPAIS